MQLDLLRGKVSNAATPAMKEKYEHEMKKEIKKLQRIRDYFRQALGNPEVKDKSRAEDVIKRIVQVSVECIIQEFKLSDFQKSSVIAPNNINHQS